MRFGLICVNATTKSFMFLAVATDIRLSPDQIQIIGQNIQAKMLEIVGRPDGQIPFILPKDEGGRLFYVNEQDNSILCEVFEALVWAEIHGLAWTTSNDKGVDMTKVTLRQVETDDQVDTTVDGLDDIEKWFSLFQALTNEIIETLQEFDDKVDGDYFPIKFKASTGGDITYDVTPDAFDVLGVSFGTMVGWRVSRNIGTKATDRHVL